jgi:universal stress protein A
MSKTYRTILVPIDFSSYSAEALLHAASIAGQFGSSLLLLHVIAKEMETHVSQERAKELGPHLRFIPGLEEVPTEVRESVTIDLREQAHTALQQFLPSDLAVRVSDLHVEVGHPVEQILEMARREHVDLIVMGTHGRSSLKYMMLGSVAERVIRLAPCPVMVVRSQEQETT